MAYLIDSDWVIDHLKEVPEATQLLSNLSGQGVLISVITYMEVYQGALHLGEQDGLAPLRDFIRTVPVLPVSMAVAERCARHREDLVRRGKKPNRRAYDLLIAATALEHDLTLVTRNVRDYRDIAGLKLYELPT